MLIYQRLILRGNYNFSGFEPDVKHLEERECHDENGSQSVSRAKIAVSMENRSESEKPAVQNSELKNKEGQLLLVVHKVTLQFCYGTLGFYASDYEVGAELQNP